MKRLVDLTDKEIAEVLIGSIVGAVKVANINRDEKYDEVDCTLTTEYEDEGGKFTIDDFFLLRNPFEHPLEVYETHFELSGQECRSIIQYCYAKGVVSREWVTDNKWLDGDKQQKNNGSRSTDFRLVLS